jgi:hypothetical protein
MSPAADMLRSPTFWLGVLALLLILAVGLAGLAWARRWSAEMRAGLPPMGLEEYMRLRDAGEISEEEFERIRKSLAARPEEEPESEDTKATDDDQIQRAE